MLDIYISELKSEINKRLKKYIVHCIYLSLISETETNANNNGLKFNYTELKSEKI